MYHINKKGAKKNAYFSIEKNSKNRDEKIPSKKKVK